MPHAAGVLPESSIISPLLECICASPYRQPAREALPVRFHAVSRLICNFYSAYVPAPRSRTNVPKIVGSAATAGPCAGAQFPLRENRAIAEFPIWLLPDPGGHMLGRQNRANSWGFIVPGAPACA